MSQAVQIRLFGAFAVRVGGTAVPEGAWRLRKAKSLVKLLALAPDRRVHRERATELLWPDRGRDAAANNFHQALYVARRALEAAGADGAAVLALRDDMLVLCPGGRRGRRRRRVRGRGGPRPGDGGGRGPPRGGRAPRRRAAAGGPLRAVGIRPAGGAERGAPGAPARPRRPAGRGRRGRGGDRGARAGGRARPAARGRPPRAHAPVRRGGAAAAGAPAVPAPARGAPARARGPARPADRGALPGAAARRAATTTTSRPAPTAGARRRRTRRARRPPEAARHNLPTALTSFVGRERELGEVARLLERHRLLTLTGAGGAGKTRLALEAATARAGALPDGVWLVELAGLGDAGLVPAATASALGLTLPSQRPALDGLGAQLAGWRGLLVLDNCEHLVTACALLAERLLGTAPGLRILATSREPLRVAGRGDLAGPVAGPAGGGPPGHARGAGLLRVGAPLLRPGDGRRPRLRARRGQRRRGRRDLLAPGRHAARPRARRGARGVALARADRRPARRQPRRPDRRAAGRRSTASRRSGRR